MVYFIFSVTYDWYQNIRVCHFKKKYLHYIKDTDFDLP